MLHIWVCAEVWVGPFSSHPFDNFCMLVVTILAIVKVFPSWWYSSTLNWFTNFLLSSLQNSIKNIQTNQLRILEPSVKNSIFCKEFERHFVNINVPTLLMSRSIYLWDWERWHGWSIWRIESFQSCPIGVWILPTLDWLYSTHWSLKVQSKHL